MKAIQLILLGCLVAGLLACSTSTVSTTSSSSGSSGTTNYKEKIVGVWLFEKSSDPRNKNSKPGDTSIEFTKDMKMILSVKGFDGKLAPLPFGEATYSVDGEDLTTTVKGLDGKDKSNKSKIKELTETDLKLEKDDDGKKSTDEYKRKK